MKYLTRGGLFQHEQEDLQITQTRGLSPAAREHVSF